MKCILQLPWRYFIIGGSAAKSTDKLLIGIAAEMSYIRIIKSKNRQHMFQKKLDRYTNKLTS